MGAIAIGLIFFLIFVGLALIWTLALRGTRARRGIAGKATPSERAQPGAITSDAFEREEDKRQKGAAA